MDATRLGADGQPTVHVPFRPGIDMVWMLSMALLLVNVVIMRDPNAAWPRSGGQIPDVIRIPWMWACLAVAAWLMIALLVRLVTSFPALRIADGRVMVYATPYRCFRFAIDDVTAVTEIVQPERRSGSHWLLGDRWFAIYFGGVAPAVIGNDCTRADLDEVHREVCTLLGVDPSPMPDPPPVGMHKGPSPVRRAFHLPDRPHDDRR